MICANCGRESGDNASFCPGCGAGLHGQQENAPGAQQQSGRSAKRARDDDSAELLGHVIDGRYRLEAKIGFGGMGTVYRASRLAIGDDVAIKMLHREHVADPNAAERFRREAHTAARLKHPNAVSIHDFGVSSDGLMYLVMELAEGQSLRHIIKERGPVPITVATDVTTQVCAALDEAQRLGIVHRDIKPDNIILQDTPAGLRVKVLDFGIAKLRDMTQSNITQTGSVMGTPRYMSPEQCMGEEVDPRSDIYSMGIVIFEMLCGVTPFNSPTSSAVVVQQVTQAPPPLCTINGSITPAVESVVLRALEKRREDRPQTAGELAGELSVAVYGPSGPRRTAVTTSPLDSRPTSSQNSGRASGATPTMAVSQPVSGGRQRTPPGTPLFPSGANQTAKVNRNYTPFIIGAVLLAVFAAVVLGVIFLGSNRTPNEGTAGANASPAPTPVAGKRGGGDPASTMNANVAPKSTATRPTPPPAVTAASADDQINTFREQISALNEHKKLRKPGPEVDEVARSIENAEQENQDDFRLPYERSKLFAQQDHVHHTAFSLLYLAATKAIKDRKSDEMRNMITNDMDTYFGMLTDHPEWNTLQRALESKDATMLGGVPHHHPAP
jgi:serine/threonine protein kinase